MDKVACFPYLGFNIFLSNNIHLKYSLLREVLFVLATLLCATTSRANVHETGLALMMTLKCLFIIEPVLRPKKHLNFATYNAGLTLKKTLSHHCFDFIMSNFVNSWKIKSGNSFQLCKNAQCKTKRKWVCWWDLYLRNPSTTKESKKKNTENKFQKIVNYKCFKIKKMSLFFSELIFHYIY